MEGKELVGRYRLLTKLGEGGMGSVWRAEHLSLQTQVAVKLIDPAIAESPEAAARFQREAQAAAELRSTHIVQIFDYGIDGNIPFIVMELLEGESLATRLAGVGRLSAIATTKVLSQVARALARAHQRGIVHRDLKPDNIFIVREDAEEVVKILDFGIAKKLDGLGVTGGIKTHTGALLGTPYYMSPEQCLGQSDIDHRTDIWAMGVIAFECILGERPFEHETLGRLLMAICNEPLPKPSERGAVPQGFDEWFLHAVNRSRNDRFHTALEAVAALSKACHLTSETGHDELLAPSIVTSDRFDQARHAGKSALAPLVQTAGPASVTIADLTGAKPGRAAWISVLPAVLLLLVSVAFVFWRWAQPVVKSEPAASAQQVSAQPIPVASNLAMDTRSMSAAGSSSAVPSSSNAVAASPRASAQQATHESTNRTGSTAPAVSANAGSNAPSRKPIRRASSQENDNAAGF
jgi:serine/threonine-protein kinase